MKRLGISARAPSGWDIHMYVPGLMQGMMVWRRAGWLGKRNTYGEAVDYCRFMAPKFGLDPWNYTLEPSSQLSEVDGSLDQADPFKLAILRASLEAASSVKE